MEQTTLEFMASWLDDATTIDPRGGSIEKLALRELLRAACEDAGQPEISDAEFLEGIQTLRPNVRATTRAADADYPRTAFLTGIRWKTS